MASLFEILLGVSGLIGLLLYIMVAGTRSDHRGFTA